jgi:hypothetical protein
MKKAILKSSALITLAFMLSLTILLFLPISTTNAQMTFTPQVDIPGGVSGKTPVGTKEGATLLGEYITGIYDYSFAVAGILAAIVLMGGGVLWLISGGNQSKVSKAKDIIGGSLIGLGILFSGYLLFNTINPALLEMKPITSITTIGAPVGSASRLGCCSCVFILHKPIIANDYRSSCQASIGLDEEQCTEICKNEASELWTLGTVLTTGSISNSPLQKWDNTCQEATAETAARCAPLTTEQAGSFPTVFYTQGWSFDQTIEEQIVDMSPELAQFLNCMRANLPSGAGKISSISDSKQIGTLTNCEGLLYDMNDCVHSKNSCHYGGGLGTNKSYAVDLGDESNKDYFKSAALACDGGAYLLDEDNHIHISISKCPKQ